MLTFFLSCAESRALFTAPVQDVANSKLAHAVDVILTQFYRGQIGAVNFFTNTKAAQDFITGVLSRQEEYSVRLENFEQIKSQSKSKKRNNMIVLDDIESFRSFNRKMTSEVFLFRGRYILVLLNGKYEKLEEIFKTFWMKNIYHVDVIYQQGDSVEVVTFLPFHGSICGDTKPKLINSFVNEKFVNGTDLIFPEKFRNLQNCSLTISTFDDYFSVMRSRKADGTVELSGFDVEMIGEISKLLNFHKTFKFEEGSQPFGVIYPNGTVTGALGEVVKGRSQIGIAKYFLTTYRLKFADASDAYFTLPEVFVISPGDKLSEFEKLLRPFQSSVWILFLAVLAFAVAVVLILSFLSTNVRAFVYGRGVGNPLVNLLIAVFGGTQPKLPRRNFPRVLLMNFLIFCLVMRNAYQGALFQYLQADKSHETVNTIDDLVEQKYEFYLHRDYAMETFENHPKIAAT